MVAAKMTIAKDRLFFMKGQKLVSLASKVFVNKMFARYVVEKKMGI